MSNPGVVQPPEQTTGSGLPFQQPPAGYPPAGYPPTGYPPQPVYPTSQTSTSNTTVVIQQPQTQVAVQGPQEWATGLFSCFDDCGVCK